MDKINKLKIDGTTEIHIRTLIEFLHDEVCSSSGDGHSAWYVRYYDINDIKKLVKEYDDDHAIGWKIEDTKDGFNWGIDQEGVVFLDNKESFDTLPDWVQARIIY